MRIICAAPAIGLASVSFAHADHWRRFDFRRSNLRQMGRCLEQRDQHQAELPYDWLGRRHQSGQQPHGGFGASDMPAAADQLEAQKLMQFPTGIGGGGVDIIVNLSGVQPTT